MKLPPFTLIHRLAATEGAEEAGHEVAERRALLESAVDPAHASFATTLKRKLNHTLVNTSFARAPAGCTAGLVYMEAVPAYERVLADLERQSKVITVGIWELGTHAGYLPWLIERLNAAQPLFTFFKIQAAVPAGLVSRPSRIKAWSMEMERLGYISRQYRETITDNIIAEDFFGRAERVRKELGVEYLIGVTPSMVAGIEDDGQERTVYWNHLAVSEGRTILTSAYGMNAHAQKAKRPFEVALALVAVAQLVATLNPRIEYHDDVGCIFDYNQDHRAIVKSLRRPMIDKECLARLAPRFRDAAVALVEELGAYERGEGEQSGPSHSGGDPLGIDMLKFIEGLEETRKRLEERRLERRVINLNKASQEGTEYPREAVAGRTPAQSAEAEPDSDDATPPEPSSGGRTSSGGSGSSGGPAPAAPAAG